MLKKQSMGKTQADRELIASRELNLAALHNIKKSPLIAFETDERKIVLKAATVPVLKEIYIKVK